jgi:hypothetical protein
LSTVGAKIVFNGTEYDGVEAMPPDVRQTYEAALASLRQTGDSGVASLLAHAGALKVKTTVRAEFVVNGKKYGSLEEMPSAVRQLYERALAAGAPAGEAPHALRPPPVLQDDQARGTRWWRLLLWLALGALAAVWLLRRA